MYIQRHFAKTKNKHFLFLHIILIRILNLSFARFINFFRGIFVPKVSLFSNYIDSFVLDLSTI